MFYSHTFLARKSPLGTVWIAAHLERRIKKPQIEVIDIPSYADCIMFPEVPIALRLSAHLLLGLVRIYSWKVNYLFQDCNRMLTDVRTVVASIQVNLPVNADHAPFESVTLPDTLELDALELDLDDSIYQASGPDNHRKAYHEITMEDQIPIEGEPYVAFFIDEDNRARTSPLPEISNPGAGPMEEDTLPPFEGELDVLSPLENAGGFSDSGPSKQAEDSVQVSPNIENLRDPAPESLQGKASNEISGPNEQSDPSTHRKVPIEYDLPVSSVEPVPSSPFDKVPTAAADDDHAIQNLEISSGRRGSCPAVVASPLAKPQKPKKRKRKQFFDESLVLTNAELKKQLQVTTKLVCKRRKLPCSALDKWRFRRIFQNERVLHEPLLSGMCNNLQEAFERRFPPSRCESASRDASLGSTDAPELEPTIPHREIQADQLQFGGHVDQSLPDQMPSPSGREEPMPSIEIENLMFQSGGHVDGQMPSPSGRGESSPLHSNSLGQLSSKGKTLEIGMLPDHEIHHSVVPEIESPSVNVVGQLHLDDTNSGEPPCAQQSGEAPSLLPSPYKELDFLEASNASSGSDVFKTDNMSARTRAVAQYLREHSPASQILEDQLTNLSLSRILERKTRKQCAIMFFETLVLKTYGFIDVQQEAAYGDILISPTPALSSLKF